MNTNKIRAATVGIAPVLLAAALLWHPPIPGGLPDHVAVAEHVAHDPTRWGLAHFAAAAASAFLILGFVAIRAHLRDALDPWISAAGLGLVVIGSTAYAVLPGMEFAVLAAHEIGADPVAAQVAIRSWFMAVLLTGGALFAVGVLGYAAAIGRVGAFSRRKTWVVVGALVVLAVSRLVPIGAVQFFVQARGSGGTVADGVGDVDRPRPRRQVEGREPYDRSSFSIRGWWIAARAYDLTNGSRAA
jgi:hypothetical protein